MGLEEELRASKHNFCEENHASVVAVELFNWNGGVVDSFVLVFEVVEMDDRTEH